VTRGSYYVCLICTETALKRCCRGIGIVIKQYQIVRLQSITCTYVHASICTSRIIFCMYCGGIHIVKYDIILWCADRKTGAVAKTPFRIAATSSFSLRQRVAIRMICRPEEVSGVFASSSSPQVRKERPAAHERTTGELNLLSSFGFIARHSRPTTISYRN